MKLPFTKMHGCGNDYIYFNCFAHEVKNPEALAIRLSDHHFGVGGDGIILICPSDVADARMRMFNADGSEGRMCGNGIRCVGKYLYDNNMVDGETEITIETLSGIKTLILHPENGKAKTVRVDMGPAALEPAEIPVYLDGDRVVDAPLVIDEKVYHITCVSMGNPHCVVFVKEDVDSLDLARLGPKFEHNPLFPERVNTEFVNVLPDGTLKMRVCGTRQRRNLGVRHRRVRGRRDSCAERPGRQGRRHSRASARRRPDHPLHRSDGLHDRPRDHGF